MRETIRASRAAGLRTTVAPLLHAPGVATPRLVTSIFAVLHLTAAIPALLATFELGDLSQTRLVVIRVVCVTAIVFGVAIPLMWRVLPRASYHLFELSSTAMITTVAVAASGDPYGLAVCFVYIYVVVNAAFFFSIVGGVTHLACAVVASASVFDLHDLHPATILLIEVLFISTFGVVAWISRMADRAEIDPLTGLPNRRSFARNLERELERAHREGGPLSLVLLDLDHFKDVNDTLGHAAGDELLVTAGQTWADAVPNGRLLARLGGDEFVLLMPGFTVGRAADLADSLRESLPPGVTGSAGVATWSHGDTTSTLVSRADVALYEAKTRGRNQTSVYGDAGRSARELERAIAAGELTMYFQKAVHMASGDTIGHEGLVRWFHPERGLVSPDEFVPQAEATGAIHLLGQWALDQVCLRAAATGRDVAVNVSVSELRNPGYVDRVREACERHGTDPAHLIIEVTEAAYDQRDDQVLHSIQGIRALGVRIAIDDFGDGYASLRWLAKFPVDILKIDGGFIQRLTDDDKIVQVVAAILSLGRALGVYVVAEQVETEEQVQILTSIGCELAQGYYFGRPEPSASVDPPSTSVALNRS